MKSIERSNYCVKRKVIKLLNEQVNKELYSLIFILIGQLLYQQRLNGFAQWFKVQA